jgi:polyhydroxyalkanoate synthase
VQAGFDVFLIDWGPQANNRPAMSDYLTYLHSSIEYIKKATGAQKVSVLGYSWGGVLSAVYASLDSSGPKNVKNLVLQSAHIDFDKDDSILASWFRRLPIDDIAQEFDGINTSFINLALVMRNPAIHFHDAMRFSLEMGELPGWINGQFWADALRVSGWLEHTSDMPSALFATYIRNLYQQNQLTGKRLEIRMNGKDGSNGAAPAIVDLQNISVPLLNIVGDFDDICPPAASLPITEIVSSTDRKIIRFSAGHIELCISARAHSGLWPRVVKWLQSRD